jgi:hypothetical protein
VLGRHPGAAGGGAGPGELVRQRVAAITSTPATLDAFWPGAKVVFPDVEREIALAFLERYPTPESAIHLGEQRMAAFLTRHRYCGRTPAAELLARLRAAPAGLAGGAEVTARRDAVLAFVGVLRALNQAIGDLDRSVIARLGEHPDSKVFASLPRSGQINAAQMLACWGDCRDAYDGPEAVAAWPASCRSPASPASTPRYRFAGRATSASAMP